MMSSFVRDPLVQSVFSDPFLNADIIPSWAGLTNVGPSSSGIGSRRSGGNVGRLMYLDAVEFENEFKIICEVPGVQKDALDVNVDNHVLSIKVNKPSPDYSNSLGLQRNEIFYGTDTRTIRLPSNCSEDPSCCQYKDGVLCMTFPKSQETKKLNIETS